MTQLPGHDLSPPVALLCENRVDPLGIDKRQPQFSWRMDSSALCLRQAAYQILVASSPNLLQEDGAVDLWDSGRVLSRQNVNVIYQGKTLKSRQRAFWKVRIWPNEESPGVYSSVATFEMALLEKTDWNVRWIGWPAGAPGKAAYFRSSFRLDALPERARLYVSGLGYYEVYVNGQRQGDSVLEPAYTDISQLVPYRTYDITPSLVIGENVLAAVVGSGWHSRSIFLAQLEVETKDGWCMVAGTASPSKVPAWLVATGPIIFNSLFDGEIYDARKEKHEWTVAACDLNSESDRADRWKLACFVSAPEGCLRALSIDPIKVIKTLKPVSVRKIDSGVYLFDFGQNHAGWCRLQVRGDAGTQITMRYAENLGPDGTVDQENLRGAAATDVYIMKGEGLETWEPRFTYHGYRYVQVEGLSGEKPEESLVSCVVRSSLPFRADFDCSDRLLNQIHQLVRWTEESNLHGVPTDCPQRDERMGWLNDLAARSEELIYNFDCARFLKKFVGDIARAQDPNTGAISDTVPFHWGCQPADPVSVCYLLIPWLLFQHHGDRNILEEHYEGFGRWVNFLGSQAVEEIVSYSYYGDWAPPAHESDPAHGESSPISQNTPGDLVSTAFYFYTTTLMARLAQRLHRTKDAAKYKILAQKIRNAFHRRFWNKELQGYGTGNQACNALALYVDLVPADLRAEVVCALVRDVKEHDYHLTTGNLCSKYLLEVLAQEGCFETAFLVATQTTYPSWGFMIESGATTLWERWEKLTGGGMNSHNHPMLGAVGSWLYRWVAGLRLAEPGETPHFEVQPPVCDQLTHAQAFLQTLWGIASVSWKRKGNILNVSVVIPWNCTGTIRLPSSTHEVDPGHHEFIEKLKESTVELAV
jgi:alpha-L-rhamnosidase